MKTKIINQELYKKFGLIVAYGRVSKGSQDTDNQMYGVKEFAKYKKFDIDLEVCEVVKSIADTRKIYDLIEELKDGDTLIVSELSRLGRNLRDLLNIMEILMKKNVRVFLVKQMLEIHEDNPAGKLQMQVLAAFAEYERALLKQRTQESQNLIKTKRNDLYVKLMEEKSKELNRSLNDDEKEECLKDAAKQFPVGRPAGAKNKQGKLDPFKKDILKDINKGIVKTKVAKIYETNRVTLNEHLKKWELEDQDGE